VEAERRRDEKGSVTAIKRIGPTVERNQVGKKPVPTWVFWELHIEGGSTAAYTDTQRAGVIDNRVYYTDTQRAGVIDDPV
jgi:hypothetical protein